MSTPEPHEFINEDLSGQEDPSGQSFVDCNFYSVGNFTGANLSGCDFTGAHFQEVNFEATNLSGSDFTRAWLDKVYLM